MIRSFLLPPAEIERLREAGGPLAEVSPEQLQTAAGRGAVAVVEVDGQIVAYWVVFYALHAEPLWVTPEQRKHPGVLRSLMETTRELIKDADEPVSFAIVGQEDLALHGVDPARLGFTRVPGDLYYLVMPGVDTPKEPM